MRLFLFQCTIIIAALLMQHGCSEDKPTEKADDVGMAYLAGTWSGEVTYIKAGSCTLAGKDSTTTKCSMNWSVDKAGNISFTDGAYATWVGFVSGDPAYVVLTRTFTWIDGVNSVCNDSIVVGSAQY
ncbi:MAG: hypothetical protein HRF51_07965, partial [bacterium]